MRFFAFPCALLALILSTSVQAAELPAPEGVVILTVRGEIENTNGPGLAAFDLEMLRAIDATDITTETIWTPGTRRFTGVRLDKLLEHVGANGESIEAMAINDYSVSIPVADGIDGGPIVAYDMDGKPMSRRDKGPLWVIYPYSASIEYRTEVIYSRSVWQLDRMTIE